MVGLQGYTWRIRICVSHTSFGEGITSHGHTGFGRRQLAHFDRAVTEPSAAMTRGSAWIRLVKRVATDGVGDWQGANHWT